MTLLENSLQAICQSVYLLIEEYLNLIIAIEKDDKRIRKMCELSRVPSYLDKKSGDYILSTNTYIIFKKMLLKKCMADVMYFSGFFEATKQFELFISDNQLDEMNSNEQVKYLYKIYTGKINKYNPLLVGVELLDQFNESLKQRQLDIRDGKLSYGSHGEDIDYLMNEGKKKKKKKDNVKKIKDEEEVVVDDIPIEENLKDSNEYSNEYNNENEDANLKELTDTDKVDLVSDADEIDEDEDLKESDSDSVDDSYLE